jgi:polar amino acid transport system substrate-binding protein
MKKLIALILVIAMVLGFAACAKTAGGNQTDMDYVKANGVLVVGITDFAPMDYKDNSGNWVGFDADMAAAFAKSLGVDVKFVEIDWDNKILELNSKSIDCVWNGMTLTDEVVNSMECSNAYCDNAQVVVVPASVADQYQDQDSVASLTFAVEAGSAGESVATELGYNCVAVQSQSAALMEVAAGTSDACVIDLLMAGAMIGEGTSYPDLTYTVALNSEKYGVGFRKGSDLAKALNDFFAAAYKDGSLMECAKLYGVQESIIAQ